MWLLVWAAAVGAAAEPLCDPIHTRCPLPWPNDFYTRPDASSPTGVRVAVPLAAMPTTRHGFRFDPSVAAIDGADGFSPNAPAVMHFEVGPPPPAR